MSCKLSNIPLKKFRKFLLHVGLKQMDNTRGRGGHEKWIRSDLLRPVTLQNHISPVPEFIVKQILRQLSISRASFCQILKEL